MGRPVVSLQGSGAPWGAGALQKLASGLLSGRRAQDIVVGRGVSAVSGARMEGRAVKSRPTPRRQRFVAEYLIDLNATQAAIRAGYSKATAYSAGQRLLKNVEVAAAVEAAMAERQVRTEITADMVIRELAKIAFLDPRKFFRPDGSLVPVHELDDDAAAGLAGLDVTIHVGGNGDETRTAKIKLADKRAALVDLGKHLGLFEPKKPLGSEENPLQLLIRSVQGNALPVVACVEDDDDEDWPKSRAA